MKQGVKVQGKKTNVLFLSFYGLLAIIFLIVTTILAIQINSLPGSHALSSASGILLAICCILFTNRYFAFSIGMVQGKNYKIKYDNRKLMKKKQKSLFSFETYKNDLQNRSGIPLISISFLSIILLIIALISANMNALN